MACGDPGGAKLCRDTDCFRHKRYGPIRVFFRASCSWRSEGLFGQSFSIVLPIQALTGLPCLGSFSIVQRVRHIEGPLAGVLFCTSVHQVFVGSASLLFSSQRQQCGEREAMAPAPTRDSAVPPCFHGHLAFLHRHFPPQSPPSHPLDLFSPQSIADLALGLFHNR